MARLVLSSQLALLVGLAVCIPLLPHVLFGGSMGGVSNFGVHARTVLPYSLGIVISAGLLLRASARLRRSGPDRMLSQLCRITAALLLLNLASTYPYQRTPVWELVHSLCAILLAGALLIGAILLAGLLRDRAGHALSAVVVGACAAMALTQLGVLHVLFVAEVTTGVGFGTLLVRAARRAGSGEIPD